MAKRQAKTSNPSTTYPTGSQQGTPSMSSSAPASFEDILNAPIDSFEPPIPTPRGTYVAVVDGPHTQGESSKQKTPYVRFKMKLLSAEPDVDQDELSESGAIGRSPNYDFYVTPDAVFRLKEFLREHLGIDLAGKSTLEALAEAPGKTCKVFVEQNLSNPTDGSEPRMISQIRRSMAE